MKKTQQLLATIISLIIITSFFGTAHAVDYPGNYTISDSSDIVSLSGYTGVSGNLIIEFTSLTSLSGLENITSVVGI
jgi:hypothetical protein